MLKAGEKISQYREIEFNRGVVLNVFHEWQLFVQAESLKGTLNKALFHNNREPPIIRT